MTVSEVRSRYLKFFAERGHAIIPSAPIVPGSDSTTLFTSSGMQPLVSYLLGQPHPAGIRLVNSQTSFRAEDIDEIGNNRHTTFFEMIGNWSLGDYFKQEQVEWIFEFLVEVINIDPKKLYITCFIGAPEFNIAKDADSAAMWQRLFTEEGIEAGIADIGSEEAGYIRGMKPGERIFFYDGKKNWWNRGKIGPDTTPVGDPCGPDSEMFYDFGTPHDTKWGPHCHPNCDCGRFVEIGNNVFMAYRKIAEGNFVPLEKPNIDHGSGLERVVMATMNEPDMFRIDAFDAARSILEERSRKKYGEDEITTKSFRVVLDHMRAATFMLADGVLPSNTEAGYILRRLIRRAIRHTDSLGIEEAMLADIAHGFGEAYKDAYPELVKKAETIRDELEKEELKFRRTLKQGMREFEKLAKKGNLSGHDAFVLFSSYGFPVEITEELASERGIALDRVSFDTEMKEHQSKSRTASEGRFKGGLADHSDVTVRYHTSHHLLLAALRQILGDSVHQRGSNITQERVRLDFSFERKLTPEELAEAERLVNEKIQERLPVFATAMPREEAEKLGAEREFGVKYGDQVTIYSMGPKDASAEDPKFKESFSLEFCGGPHVSNTRELADGDKSFRIIKEESVAAGIRRIKAVLN